MNRKPWPIVILAFFQIIAPVFGILLSSYLDNMSPYRYFKIYINVKPAWDIFEFFFLFPIAGFAILIMKRWSFPFFIVAMIWSIISNLKIWMSDYSENWGVWIIVLITVVNLAVVTYFLLPAVRRFYFNKQLRWWESKPRFKVEIVGIIEYKDLTHKCMIRDLSEGGAFIESDIDVSDKDQVNLQVSVLNKRFPINGIVVHKRASAPIGYGIEFKLNKEEKNIVTNLVRALQLLGCNVSRIEEPMLESFLSWLNGLKSGKGIVPKT